MMELKSFEHFSHYFTKKGEHMEFKHQKPINFPLLPYVTKLVIGGSDRNTGSKLDFKSFEGHIGYCYRRIIGEAFHKDHEEGDSKVKLKAILMTNVRNAVEFLDVDPGKLEAIVESQYFDGNDLLKFSVESQAYLYWEKFDSGLENIAEFILSVFVTEQVKAIWLTKKGHPEHLLHRLINESLPKLEKVKEKPQSAEGKYRTIIPEIVELFTKDFELLAKSQKALLGESESLFKFYYFSYISRLSMRLNQFFNEPTQTPLYFTLESETVSEGRRTNESGWKFLERKITTLMSHGVCLDLVNLLPLVRTRGGLDYQGLKQLFESLNAHEEAEILGQLKRLITDYTNALKTNDNWASFDKHYKQIIIGCKPETQLQSVVMELFARIEYQFDQSSRASKRKAFASWFTSFSKENFLKNRGRNGYSLNLSTEMLLFLTKLCIGDQKKIRLNELMAAFRERGLHFDNHTQQTMLAIYEKINLIEKKSDSGDAQFIRAIL